MNNAVKSGARAAVLGLMLCAGSTTACKKEPAVSTTHPSSAVVTRASSADLPPRGRDTTEGATGDEAAIIRLERGACYGVCPVYSVELQSDGTVTYRGERFVLKRGTITSKLPPAAVLDLANRLADQGLLRMKWKVPCDPGRVHTDDTTVTTTFIHEGRKRVIRDYHGDSCIPPELRALENEIDRVAGTAVWTKCPGDDFCMR